MAAVNPWFPYPTTGTGIRLYCLAHSGASAGVFKRWIGELGEARVIPMERPGRAIGWLDDPYTEMPPLAHAVAEAIAADAGDDPYVILGHSVGALIGFEAAHLLRDKSGLRHLVVSGHPAPDDMGERARVGDLADEELLANLAELGGTPSSIAPLFLTSFRADSLLGDGYVLRRRRSLDIPFTIITANGDQQASEENMLGWRRHTMRRCAVRRIEGDHFALLNRPTPAVRRYLRAALAPSSRTEVTR